MVPAARPRTLEPERCSWRMKNHGPRCKGSSDGHYSLKCWGLHASVYRVGVAERM
jgi:hypothetical protein